MDAGGVLISLLPSVWNSSLRDDTAHSGVGLPFSDNALWKHPHAHAQSFVSWDTLNPVRLARSTITDT